MQVYSTSSRTKVELEPNEAGKLGIYVCGPTVYDEPHLGHARYAIVFDVLRRYLAFRGFDVTYVSNYTDVDDRIINRAKEEGVSPEVIAEKYIGVWDEYMALLGNAPPDIGPRATEHIGEMIEMISALVEEGKAYESDGDVYFSIAAYPGYGELSGRKLDELEAGARVEPGESKRDPLDFALWKASKPGEPTWESPWGAGRPGWHIECSAMSLKYLGPGFDIHGGGQDLIFPHHENERAQAEAAGIPFARVWIHSGLVNLDGEKMSKSTGRFIRLGEILDRYDPQVVRLVALQSHYRRPVDFGPPEAEQAAAAIERIREFDRRARSYAKDEVGTAAISTESPHTLAFIDAMDDDLNTPEALGAIFELIREGNQAIDEGQDASVVATLLAEFSQLASILGLSPASEAAAPAGAANAMVEAVLTLRNEARASKEWELADRLRELLNQAGVVVEDAVDGGSWHWRTGAGD